MRVVLYRALAIFIFIVFIFFFFSFPFSSLSARAGAGLGKGRVTNGVDMISYISSYYPTSCSGSFISTTDLFGHISLCEGEGG